MGSVQAFTCASQLQENWAGARFLQRLKLKGDKRGMALLSSRGRNRTGGSEAGCSARLREVESHRLLVAGTEGEKSSSWLRAAGGCAGPQPL